MEKSGRGAAGFFYTTVKASIPFLPSIPWFPLRMPFLQSAETHGPHKRQWPLCFSQWPTGDPLVEDQDFRNAGEVGGGGLAYFFSGCVHDLTSGTFIDRFYRRYEEKSRRYLGLDVAKVRSPFSTKIPLHICTTFSTKSAYYLLTFLYITGRIQSNKGN